MYELDAKERQGLINDAIELGYPEAAGMLVKGHEHLLSIENARSFGRPIPPVDPALLERMRNAGSRAAMNGGGKTSDALWRMASLIDSGGR